MTLSSAQRARYARHLLLPEIGEGGQARLLKSQVGAAADADPGALAVARSYLERAGVRVADDAEGSVEVSLNVPDRARIEALAGSPLLLEAARALAGALAAVETIKSVVGIGQPSELPEAFSLASEDA
jgi:hypothetical protein